MGKPGLRKSRINVRSIIAAEMESEKVIEMVCAYFGLSLDDINKPSQKRVIVYKRQMIMYFLAYYTTMTYKEIGRIFGKDHTTVIHAKDLIRDLMETTDKTRNDVEDIRKKLVEAYF